MHQSSFIGSYAMNSPRSMTVLKDLSNIGPWAPVSEHGSNPIIEWAIR